MKKIERKWGNYRTLIRLPFFAAKILTFYPDHKLSYQKHWYRREFWIMLSGTGIIEIGKKSWNVKPGSTAYIPCKTYHWFHNTTDSNTTFIELQWGKIVHERDIFRTIRPC